jgi:hypothetical protein
MTDAAIRAYYQAYGTLPSESLIPSYTSIYANDTGLAPGQLGPASPFYNPFAVGAEKYDARYGRGDSQGGGYYDANGVWVE